MQLIGRSYGKLKLVSGWVIVLMAGSSILHCETKLSAVANGTSSFKIRLQNDTQVAGLQFVLRSSSDVVLQEIHTSDRSAGGDWSVAYNRLNDSTLSVVLVSTDLSYFADGDGAIAEVTMSLAGRPSMTSRVTFANVVVADPSAQLVTVTTGDLYLGLPSASSHTLSSDFSLGQNYPNPFNPATRISYQLTTGAYVQLSVYDITGREVSRLVDQSQPAGTYSVTWNSSSGPGFQLSSGTYFARLQVGDQVQTRKMILTK